MNAAGGVLTRPRNGRRHVETASMSKQQMIEAIRQHNRSAPDTFLVAFEERALESYLRRLTTVQGRRGRGSVWVREAETPAIVTRAMV